MVEMVVQSAVENTIRKTRSGSVKVAGTDVSDPVVTGADDPTAGFLNRETGTGRSAAALMGLASILAVVGSVIAWKVAGNSLIGIDDANITAAYGRNIADGFGFVYQPHGERVEGSTSLLWTLVNALCFAVTPHAEWLVGVISLIGAALSCYFVLDLARLGAGLFAPARTRGAIAIAALVIVSFVQFFVWCVLSLMDVGLWVTCFLWIFWLLARDLVESERRPSFAFQLALACLLTVATRPEGIAVTIGMIGMSGLLGLARQRTLRSEISAKAPGITVAVLAFAAIEVFRILYFGSPLPNTFYAKVSLSPFANLAQGASYTLRFFIDYPLALPGLVGWLVGAGLAVQQLVAGRGKIEARSAAGLFGFGTILMMVVICTFLGGDHFVGFRFYQPIVFLLPLSLLPLIALVADWAQGAGAKAASTRVLRIVGYAIPLIAVIVTNLMYSYVNVNRDAMKNEFSLASDGRAVGLALNKLAAAGRPISIGVTPAGGVAMTFTGKIYDLLGLNWREMAHAEAIKSGPTGHGGFNKDVFWRNPPDIVEPRLLTSIDSPYVEVIPFDLRILKGLQKDQQFRDRYIVATFDVEGRLVQAFVAKSWLEQAGVAPVRTVPWENVILHQ
jgi:arabinofuranosyltransferase